MTDTQVKYWQVQEMIRHNEQTEKLEHLGKMLRANEIMLAQSKLPFETAKLKAEARSANVRAGKDLLAAFGDIIPTGIHVGALFS